MATCQWASWKPRSGCRREGVCLLLLILDEFNSMRESVSSMTVVYLTLVDAGGGEGLKYLKYLAIFSRRQILASSEGRTTVKTF